MKSIKSAVRRAVRGVKGWLREPPRTELDLESERLSNSAYQTINCILLQWEREHSRGLRPHYSWGVLHAAHLGRALGYKRISVIEFGVAGGNGLIALESAAMLAEKQFDIGIDVYGFDTGKGLPQPQDYRDLPNLFIPDSYNDGLVLHSNEQAQHHLQCDPNTELVPQLG